MSKKPPGKELASTMTTREFQTALQAFWTQRCRELMHERGNLPEDELGYVVEQVAKLKDERLKACIAELIGWVTTNGLSLRRSALSLWRSWVCAALLSCGRPHFA